MSELEGVFMLPCYNQLSLIRHGQLGCSCLHNTFTTKRRTTTTTKEIICLQPKVQHVWASISGKGWNNVSCDSLVPVQACIPTIAQCFSYKNGWMDGCPIPCCSKHGIKWLLIKNRLRDGHSYQSTGKICVLWLIGQLKVAASIYSKSHNLEFSLVTERHHKQTFYENSKFCKKRVFWVTNNLSSIVFQKRLITFNSVH